MRKFVCGALSVVLAACAFAGCKKGGSPEESSSSPQEPKKTYDLRLIDDVEYTQASLTAIDKTGRIASPGDERNGNDVGIFYHTWHGNHETPGEVLNIREIMEKNPDYLKSDYLGENGGKFHYWDEPLYGYYCSDDPWIVTRHIELMIAMGVDFFVYDYTNNVCYDKEADLIFETLEKFRKQGFKVPKVTMYTNTGSSRCVVYLYNRYFADSAPLKGKYDHLWYSPNGKPLIIGVSGMAAPAGTQELYDYLTSEFFDFRESQWPDGKTTITDTERGFPWMNWEYPQGNYNGYMSVSLSQHPGARMSAGARTNYGRGYDFALAENIGENAELGTNYQAQWQSVFENNEDPSKQKVNTVMITGFNEWMAIKHNDGENSFFVDLFSEEYSRDVEMMKGGYDDNFVIQTLANTRKFRYSDPKSYLYEYHTIDIEDDTLSGWNAVAHSYIDLSGDAIARNYRDCFRTTTYVDNSNRNDIEKVTVTHDGEFLYVKVKTAENVTAYNGTDENWMNLFIHTGNDNENSFGGFQYVINRKPENTGTTSVERSKGGYVWETAGQAQYRVYGDSILYKIPLSALSLTKENCRLSIKATDNVTRYDDIMDYYVSGDSAPIGRFAYSYGY